MKYELTSTTKKINGITLYQIRALQDFGQVKTGDIGGWIEKEDNLSQEGNCWVSGNAKVYGNAKVSGNALVYDNAWVSGNAKVSGNARVAGTAWAFDDAMVYGDAVVSGNAKVYGKAKVSGKAKIYDNAMVSGDAKVSGDAVVYGNAWVSGYAKVSGDAVVFGEAKVSNDEEVFDGEIYESFKNCLVDAVVEELEKNSCKTEMSEPTLQNYVKKALPKIKQKAAEGDKGEVVNTAKGLQLALNKLGRKVNESQPEPYKIGTKVSVGGKIGEIAFVKPSNDPEFPHQYKVTDLSSDDPHKQTRLENGHFIPHSRINVEVSEKKLTRNELKKREDVAKAIEKKNPKMLMKKKMAIATATAKRVTESTKNIQRESVGEPEEGWCVVSSDRPRIVIDGPYVNRKDALNYKSSVPPEQSNNWLVLWGKEASDGSGEYVQTRAVNPIESLETKIIPEGTAVKYRDKSTTSVGTVLEFIPESNRYLIETADGRREVLVDKAKIKVFGESSDSNNVDLKRIASFVKQKFVELFPHEDPFDEISQWLERECEIEIEDQIAVLDKVANYEGHESYNDMMGALWDEAVESAPEDMEDEIGDSNPYIG